MLNPHAQAWVDALRSGKYTQGKGSLTENSEDRGSFDCCLGVACKLAIIDGVKLSVYEDRYGNVHYNGEENYLPEPVQAWLGLSTNMGQYATVPGTRFGHGLAGDNDGGKTFTEIADIIEQKAEILFGNARMEEHQS